MSIFRSALLATAILLAPSAAQAQESPRQTYEAELSTLSPGKPTGLMQAIDYLPAVGADKPYAVSKVTVRLPKRARIDTTAVPACAASDAELIGSGPSACPPETIVGAGSLSADTGFPATLIPRVIETDVTFINNVDQLILLAESTNVPDPGLRIASRIVVRKRAFISTIPPLPGAAPPDPFLALDEVVNELERIRSSSGPYIRAPRRCPARGFWTVRATFEYRDGTVQKERSRTACR